MSDKIMQPKNGVYIIQGEMLLVVTAMRRTSRWNTHIPQEEEQDPLIAGFSQLKDLLNSISDLSDIEPNNFLSPFLDVIRSEDTTGPITGLALSSVNKFLSYGLLDPAIDGTAAGIENIADAVTHARFVGTDPGSDEVVLMKILQVLRTLLLTPVGCHLTNESVCEIMQSCFRICFEMRLSELLRRSAEQTLVDMVQLLFSRLPQFKEEKIAGMRKLKMRAGGIADSRRKKSKQSPKNRQRKEKHPSSTTLQEERESTATSGQPSPAVSDNNIASEPEEQELLSEPRQLEERLQSSDCEGDGREVVSIDDCVETPDGVPSEHGVVSLTGSQGMEEGTDRRSFGNEDGIDRKKEDDANYDSEKTESLADGMEDSESITEHSDSASVHDSDYVNPHGVRFTPQQRPKDGSGPLIPYGLPCVRELFRFLISLINPYDRHNTDVMIHMGLSLLTISLETGCDHISHFSVLLSLVKDDMCRHLFALLQADRLSLFASSVRVCFLLFESMRTHLKFQLEMYLLKLVELIVSESPKIMYEQREMALDAIVQLWRIPSLVAELYLNYDCDIYCTNLFEDLTKLLSKNAFPVSGSLYTTHLLSLDALLAVIDAIEANCHHRILSTMAAQSTERITSESGIEIQIQDMSTKQEGKLNVENERLEGSPCRRCTRFPPSPGLPAPEDLVKIKHRKKLLQAGTDQFNQKPSKGIAFLQENNILRTPLDPKEMAQFLKENPKLDKKQIGEYVSNKKNTKVLEAYMRQFAFEDTRIDESLRMYLEAFRLPGEAPVIQNVLEHFSDHWHKSNHQPFANNDAAFTLAYAVIMLNVDQHNHNAKKQNIPMTVAEFKKNLLKVNGGEDFDQSMLEEVYSAIRNEEIVMPAEQTGLVRENYIWRCLLKRGCTLDGTFLHTPAAAMDKELFLLTWGPTVAALSFVFDKSPDEKITLKAISGFRKCAMISAHYGLSDVFDNLVISLCKFTTLMSSGESPEMLPIVFGSNMKAQLAAKNMFGLAHRHGDILGEGWKNILDCMLQLFKAKLLPSELVDVDDFVASSGSISLLKREEMPSQRSDSSLLSSFVYYFTANTETSTQRGPTPEDQEAIHVARNCIEDCHPEHLLTESKFLRIESLQDLIKALTFASQGPQAAESTGTPFDEEAAVFNLELLIRVVFENRDRVSALWQSVRDHLYSLIVSSSEHGFLVERAVVGLLRLAIRLLRREEISGQVIASLRMLFMMRPSVLHKQCRQISHALYELLRTNAANIHTPMDWYTLFTLLECVGAGAIPPPMKQVAIGTESDDCASVCGDHDAQSDSELSVSSQITTVSDHGYTSDSELYNMHKPKRSSSEGDVRDIGRGGWLVVKKDEEENKQPHNQYEISLDIELRHHDTKSLMKCCEVLAFLVRDAAHVTPDNFESCVHCIRTFVEATVNGGRLSDHQRRQRAANREVKDRRGKKSKKKMPKTYSVPDKIAQVGDHEDEEDAALGGYHSLSIQLLDLMHTLHTKAATIFSSWAEEQNKLGEVHTIDAGASALWIKCWCPLLQGIARLCCDTRRQVRMQAFSYLQRALLVHDLQTLSATEWESSFNIVLFPLLTKLLTNINSHDPDGVEETRMRAATLLCKVFLQHLSPLLSLATFTALWLTILDFMDKYMHADKSDLLFEAIPESLKNMLLVMHTAGILSSEDQGDYSPLWHVTWERIDCFLPQLKHDLFRPREPSKPKVETVVDPSDAPKQDSSIPRDGAPKVKEAEKQKENGDVENAVVRSASPAQIILQPPLPSAVPIPHDKSGASVPILLNPNILQTGGIQGLPILGVPVGDTANSS
ncbi:Golgi-specific brefeldin A-resistance guanine nucleotide exchange factor 1-like isoform X2 [Antedon mediterranea]|uniref:Golgi-specific brefeldin A-resistance guanine nucleotide exchange factor 1-like isoform X2 n=1 Tax=Antedon mediterranea TaxID=105859 RepID=UPI003AF4FCFB